MEVIKTIQDTIKRQGTGFFTLDEAAHLLAEHLGTVSPKTMLDNLLDAGRNCKLVIRHVDTQLPITPSKNQIFPYAHVKISDINAWLETQGVNYRFPNVATIGIAHHPVPPAPLIVASAHSGTGIIWTSERKEIARVMMTEKKGRGVRAFAAETAAAFGVTATRLREVLRDKPKKMAAKKARGVWDV